MAKKAVELENAEKPAVKKRAAKSTKKSPETAESAEKAVKKAPARKKKTADTVTEPVVSQKLAKEEQIRLAAYFKWEERGCRQGTDVEDWIEAEDSLTD
ncbi:MAG: DUF2934 domain-containing protein [Chlorobium sp.]|uniref:DUF2934 domain-containing protein n=1 Tax=Chlorobium sp. TaxID=1095 RepID=UPI0025BDA2B3|nr:DUF2934 domain-containing protein [Chlorobium sp.]MCF8215834.1 DUF2934 domain-containing protein [Chlorobium sp.]MCF8270732.1 DUF2934 domain-containing protein [Chlorobium sp.]MCF8287044.1 DUF2934 domain-containing protein [Chlorobium sp.]MCF8290701.1 DUF2934 domain-containing protein [Chlorobium sp.]MCF8384805.1 DUF2934 domain-containing protein [Chlorobium sp.]